MTLRTIVALSVLLATGCHRFTRHEEVVFKAPAIAPEPAPPAPAQIAAAAPALVAPPAIEEPLPLPPLDEQVPPREPVVHFGFDSATLDEHARTLLDDAVATWQRTGHRVRVEGHADEQGSTEWNLLLSQARASAVRRYLEALGVPADRIEVVGFGELKPVDPSHSPEAWAANRRAEVSITR